jgi:two-component system, OmpR family, manganese sensing response regulator
MPKILLVDDDNNMTTMVKSWLTAERYLVEVVDNGSAALDRLACSEYDVIVLDRNLPDMTGIDICRQFRATGGSTPVLMLTGDKTLQSKEDGFGAGADDYLGKPFHVRELALRLQALIRRSGKAVASDRLQCGCLELDQNSKRVFKNGVEVELVQKEFILLEFLMRHPAQYFTADALLTRLWSSESEASVDAIRQCIKRLRSKIDDSEGPSLIKNTHGLGYKLNT